MEEILAILKETGIPFAYDHFAEGCGLPVATSAKQKHRPSRQARQAPEPPFICYLTPESNNFAADGYVYHKINGVHIELYTDEKSPATEKKLEDALDNHRVFYNKTETWIDSEKLYEVLYQFEFSATC